MRTLIIKNIEHKIPITSMEIYNIIIENPIFLRNIIMDLRNDAEYFTYCDEQKNSFQADSLLILNPFDTSFDIKKAEALLQKEISARITYSQKEEYESLKNLIFNYINSITYDYPIPLSFHDDLPLSTLLKSLNLSPSLNEASDIGVLIQNVKALSYLLKKDIFIFFNLKDFYSESEIMDFLMEMSHLEIKILLLSSHQSNRFKIEHQILIDDDLCELDFE